MVIIKDYRQVVLIVIALISLLFVYLLPIDHYFIKSFFRIVLMGIIVYYGLLRLPPQKMAIHIFIMVGLFFSIVGDAVYYWPILEFILAPIAILDGYMFYTIGFLTQIRFSLIRCLTIIPIALLAYILLRILYNALESSGTGFLIFLLFVYIFFIAIMCWAAFLTGNKWAIAGSLLFTISDTIKSYQQFIQQMEYAEILIIVTYFAAQLLIVHSIGTFTKRSTNSTRRQMRNV